MHVNDVGRIGGFIGIESHCIGGGVLVVSSIHGDTVAPMFLVGETEVNLEERNSVSSRCFDSPLMVRKGENPICSMMAAAVQIALALVM